VDSRLEEVGRNPSHETHLEQVVVPEALLVDLGQREAQAGEALAKPITADVKEKGALAGEALEDPIVADVKVASVVVVDEMVASVVVANEDQAAAIVRAFDWTSRIRRHIRIWYVKFQAIMMSEIDLFLFVQNGLYVRLCSLGVLGLGGIGC